MASGTRGEIARRSFLKTMAVLGVPVATVASIADRRRDGTGARNDDGSEETRVARAPLDVSVGYPRNDLERVQAVVGASHGNLDVVRQLVLEQPALAKSSWDWGFGDWETTLGAASHTGRREIADFVIAHGARPTLFSAAMLGQVDTVRAFLSADPGLYMLHGPHGIPLLNHARAGGADAERVVDYLLATFGPDDRSFGMPADDAVGARYAGTYRFDTDPAVTISVGVSTSGMLQVGGGDRPVSRVLQVEPDVFHPTGAPSVRLRFQVVDGRAEGLTIEDGPVLLSGRRADG